MILPTNKNKNSQNCNYHIRRLQHVPQSYYDFGVTFADTVDPPINIDRYFVSFEFWVIFFYFCPFSITKWCYRYP